MKQGDKELVIEWAKLVFKCLSRILLSYPHDVIGKSVQVATNGEVSDERLYALCAFLHLIVTILPMKFASLYFVYLLLLYVT